MQLRSRSQGLDDVIVRAVVADIISVNKKLAYLEANKYNKI